MHLPPARLAKRTLALALAAAFGHAPGAAWAQTSVLPTGPTIVHGTADVQLQGSGERMVIANSANAILNWNSFSIGQQNTVQFIQPSAASKVLNRVTGNDPSNILGSLSSNGQVWLVNPNGVLFGANARVDVGALVASGLGISDQDFLGGRFAFGTAGVAGGQVLNQGSLSTSFGGHVWLVGGSVRNDGTVTSPGGRIVLAAGQSIELVDSGAPNVTVRVSAPGNEVVNLGQLLAPGGGSIDLHGAIVNQQGIVRADSLDGGGAGRILIRAAGNVLLEDGSQTSASADAEGNAAGGRVTVESTGGTSTIRGSVSATGAGHAGGQIQLLGRDVKIETADGIVDASGSTGGGEILIGTAQLATTATVPDANSVLVGLETQIRANATNAGNGGSIVVRSDGTTQVSGSMQARSGVNGGQGGLVETSGAFVDAWTASIDIAAANGSAGSWLLRANNVTLVDDACRLCRQTPGEVQETIVTNTLLRSVLEQGAQVRLEAGSPDAAPQTGKLKVTADMLAEAPLFGARLTLAAQNDLVVNSDVSLGSAVNPMPVSLIADLDHDGAGALLLGAGAGVFTGGADLVLGGNSTGNGNAQRISLTRTTLDAGTGNIHITGSTVDIGAQSQLYGGAITVAGGALALQDTTLLAHAPGRPGLITLNGITVDLTRAQLIVEGNARITGTSGISLDNTLVSAEAQGDAIVLSTARLAATGSQLAAPDGRWLTYLDTPGAFSPTLFDTLGYTFVQVGAGSTAAPALSGRGANGVIVRAPMDVRVKVDATRVYDGTAQAAFSTALENDLAPAFVLQGGDGTLQGRFSDKNVGTGKRIAVDGSAAPFAITTATGQPVYGANQTYVADIIPKSLTASLAAANKVYDATRTATVSATLSGTVAGDDVRLDGATGLFDTKDAGTRKTVTLSTGTLDGADANNYRLDSIGIALADITPRPLTPIGLQAQDKVYDGNRTAVVSGSLGGAVAGDAVSLDLAGRFDTRDAGTGKAVALTGTLIGADAANYTVDLPSSVSADITQRLIEIVLTGEVRKEYDATAQASLPSGAFRLDGILPGETLSIRGPAQVSFASPDVGRNKPVNAQGAFEIDGADAANYRIGTTGLTGPSNLIQATVTGNVGTITPATLVYEAFPVTALGGLAIGPLDGTVTGFKGGDTLAGATTGTLLWQGTATPASAPGAYAVVGSGLSAANYQFVQAPGNATALALRAGLPAGGPQQSAVDGSILAIGAAVQAALPTVALPVVSSGVFDRSGAAPARAFDPVRLGSMNQDEIGRMLAERKDFKRKLFADAIYKLAIDPSLADVRPCATAADAASGTCRITPEQVAALQAATAQASAHVPAAGTHGAKARAASLPQIERKIAVLFGINDYTDKDIPQLVNAIPDADAVARVFADKLGYEVRVVRNPDKAEIVRVLNGLAAEAGSADSVVVYYAGHGFSMEKNGAGYWLAADARVTNPKGWISNGDIAHLLSGIRSKQVALISDSCYSGAFTREGLGAIGKNVMAATVDNVLAKRSVVVLSSGGDEPVPDEGKDGHSIFAWNLMQVIGSVQDWKPGSTIFSSVQAGVRKEFPQTPRYGSLTAAGHQAGGEYLFESRSN